MTQTVGQAVERQQNSPAAMIANYRGDFATVLPAHIKPETFVRLAQGVLRRDEQLAQAARQNPGSLMHALLEAARLGHEPGTESFYLVPYGGEVQGIEGYRGVVERIYRAGAVSSVKAEVVYSGDEFLYDPAEMDRPRHRVNWFGDRGEIIGAYSYAIMRDGSTSRAVIIDKAYIDKVRRESRGADKPSSPWQKWPEAMVLKTVAHRLEPWVPTSSEWMREQLRAVRDVKSEQTTTSLPGPAVDEATGEIFDAEVVDELDTEPGGAA